MPRPRLFSIRRRSPPGAPPGTLIAPTEAEPPVIDVLAYTKDRHVEHEHTDADTVRSLRAQEGITWVNLTGLGDAGSSSRSRTFSVCITSRSKTS